MHFQLPYPSQVTSKPYPKDYVMPKFRLFDGKKGKLRSMLLVSLMSWEYVLMIMILN